MMTAKASNILRTHVAAMCWLSLASFCPADEPALAHFEFQQVHMGTQFKIVLYARDEPSARLASQATFARIEQLDAILSDYRAESELMAVCRQAGGPPVRVSDELFFVITRARELSERTDGAFDVTVGPVVRLWRRARRMHELPNGERLAQARQLVGYDKLRLDPTGRSVQLLKPGMQLDLGGIAKGYAADEALAVLKRHGVARALVAAGGDIAVSGPPPERLGWTIAVAPLDGAEQSPSRLLLLHDAAVSTSGDAEQFVEIDGKRYSHIVDPKTGLGLVGRSSVTVTAPNGITADGLATAVSVLGPERGLELVESTDGAAALIVSATESGLVSCESSRFKEIPRGEPRHAPP